MKKIAIVLVLFALFAISSVYAAEPTASSLTDMSGRWRDQSLYQTVSHNWNTFLRFLVTERADTVSSST